MNKISDLINQNDFVQLNIYFLLANVFIGFILALILRSYYNKFGNSISNKEQFSKIFPLLTVTIVLIISIVKSSLALSLGLVGALSIVRFRTPIKDPEELVFLFLCIAIGLGLGANQTLPTIVVFIFIIIVLAISQVNTANSKNNKGVFLNFAIKANTSTKDKILLRLNEIIRRYDKNYNLRRFDFNQNYIDIGYSLNIGQISELQNLSKTINKNFPSSNITVIDQNGIPSI